MIRDPYAVLHVARDAPLEVINAAFRALARNHHPDTGGSTATMAVLAAARDLLLDPRSRSRIDYELLHGPGMRSLRPDAPPAAAVVMPWGIHEGRRLAEIPSDYLEWLAGHAYQLGLRRDAGAVLAWRRRAA